MDNILALKPFLPTLELETKELHRSAALLRAVFRQSPGSHFWRAGVASRGTAPQRVAGTVAVEAAVAPDCSHSPLLPIWFASSDCLLAFLDGQLSAAPASCAKGINCVYVVLRFAYVCPLLSAPSTSACAEVFLCCTWFHAVSHVLPVCQA